MITIRQATIADVPLAAHIFDAYRVHFGQTRNLQASTDFLLDRFKHSESILFIAIEKDKAIGIAHLYPSYSSLSMQRVWILNDFYIQETKRGKGLGGQLYKAVKQYCVLTKAKGIELSVEHNNMKAWTFWEGQGFEIDKEFRYYFSKV